MASKARISRGAPLGRDAAGSVLPMVAISMLVLASLVGGGVDMARAYKAERRLQAACDAGALAGRRAITTNGFDANAEAQADQYFNANFNDDQQETTGTDPSFTSPDDGATVVGNATTNLNTIIMNVFGFRNFNLSVSCSASMGVGNADVMFVLDSTGSMASAPDGERVTSSNPSKITSLRAAMKSFYDTVATSTEGSNARVRYGFLPYSSSVNVGRLIRDADSSYLADTIVVPSVEFVNWSAPTGNPAIVEGPFYTSSSTVSNWTNISGQYPNPNGTAACQAALPQNTGWSDYGSATSTVTYSVSNTNGRRYRTTGIHQPQQSHEYRCSSRRIQERVLQREARSSIYDEEQIQIPVTGHDEPFAAAILQNRTIDVSSYKTFSSTWVPVGIRSSGTRTSFRTASTWAGCIKERETTPASSFSFVSLALGITPEEAHDLDIDGAPDSDSTRWTPLWPEVAYVRDAGMNYQEIVDGNDNDTNIQNEFPGRASSGCPQRAQLLAEMEEDDFDDYADSLIASGSTYHDIGILWGARLSSPSGIWASNVNEEPDNGSTVSRHMIFMTDGQLEPSLTVNSSYGIERVERRITGNGSSTTQYDNHRSRFLALCEAVKARGIRLWVIAFGTSLTNDLVTCATDGYASAFQANNASELDENFQEIAKQVGELRIVQ